MEQETDAGISRPLTHGQAAQAWYTVPRADWFVFANRLSSSMSNLQMLGDRPSLHSSPHKQIIS